MHPSFQPISYFFYLKNFLKQFLCVGLLTINCQFYLSEKVFLIHFWKIHSLGIEFYVVDPCAHPRCSALKMLLQHLLAYVTMTDLCSSHFCFSLCSVPFFPGCLQDFLLILFPAGWLWWAGCCAGLVTCLFIYLSACVGICPPWCYLVLNLWLGVCHYFGNVLVIISSNASSGQFSFSSLSEVQNMRALVGFRSEALGYSVMFSFWIRSDSLCFILGHFSWPVFKVIGPLLDCASVMTYWKHSVPVAVFSGFIIFIWVFLL